MRGGAPVYIVKPKYIFKHPFNKYDLGNPTNRQTQNEELTDYFNYGYNEDTMNIYGKLVKRFIEVLDHNKNLEYFNEPSELMRLNDEIPMDFGGFCKFHNPYIVDNQTREDFHSGQPLMRYFIMMIFASASRKIEYPLIEFIKNMYKKEGEEDGTQDTILFDIIEQIGKNLEQRYQETMEKLRTKQNQLKNPPKKHEGKEREGKEREGKEHREPKENRQNRGNKDRQNRQNRGRDRDIQHESKDKDRDRDRERGERQKEKEKQREKQREKIQPEKSGGHKDKNHIKKDKGGKKSQHDSSDSSEDSSDSSSSQQSDDRKRKHEKEGGRSKSEDQRRKNKKKDRVRDKKKKQKKDKDKDKDREKDKHKTKKVKKQKSHKRSKSRDKKKKHH